ncbi:MAG: type II CAAX prenyl endopeptidase Rce1 family protein [Lachnospiraceae bacterium]
MKKAGQFLFNVVPMLLGVLLQFFAMIPITGIYFLYHLYAKPENGADSFSDYMDSFLDAITGTEYMGAVSIAFSILCILVFGFWYLKRYHVKRADSQPKFPHIFTIFGIALLAVGLQYLTNYLVAFLSMIQPDWLANYENLVETAGLDDMSGLMMIYGVLVAPIGEELIFRGVTMHHALRSMPFWAANIIQALMFGIFHMNIIQGCYAFFAALFLGYIAYTSGGLFLPILMHMFFNFISNYLPDSSVFFGKSTIGYCSAAVVAVLITSYGIALYKKGRECQA